MILPGYSKFHSLGYRLFGPIISPALDWIVTEAEQNPTGPLLFIGREGYFLRALADHLRAERQIRSEQNYLYLNASRSFLFKLLLNTEHVNLTLAHWYRGTVASFFSDRYFLNKSDSDRLSGSFGYASIELPRDADLVMGLIEKNAKIIGEQTAKKRGAYLAYLNGLVGDGEQRFVDVGFSGTIQKCIGALTGAPTIGYYFYKSKSFNQHAPPGSHIGNGYWSNEAEFGKQDPLIDFSMVLESLLTAPWGTLRDIKPYGARSECFVYDDFVPNREQFYVLEAIIAGVRQHITDFVRAGMSGEAWSDLVDVRMLYDLILRFDGSEEMTALRNLFEIDDSISGFGKVKPFEFLPGL
ncbi:hypothetical protein [Rhizobium sp. LjRoot254]|uniref:hypothetical protein n=1 Tax=Rhizobium sp. LjRoot254 TaxID=3342297 RepID=UPI003ECC51F5